MKMKPVHDPSFIAASVAAAFVAVAEGGGHVESLTDQLYTLQPREPAERREEKCSVHTRTNTVRCGTLLYKGIISRWTDDPVELCCTRA